MSVPRRQTWKFKIFHDRAQILIIRFLSSNKNLLIIKPKKMEELTELLCCFFQASLCGP